MTDAQLCAATLDGDTGAFGALVSRYQDLAFAMAYGATADAGLAEDLAQEAFVVAWRRLAKLADRDRFAPWLCGIVRNLAHEARRHERRHAPRGTEVGLFDLADPGPSPFESAAVREALAVGVAALDALAPRYREPLLLFVRLDRSHARVAACLGLTVEAVRQRLSRARRQLRGDIEQTERAARAVRARRSMAAPVIAAVLLARAPSASAAPAPIIAPHALPLVAKMAAAVATACVAVIVVSGSVAWRQQMARAGATDRAADRASSAAHDLDLGAVEAADAARPSLLVDTGRDHQARATIPTGYPAARRPRPARGRVRHGPAQVAPARSAGVMAGRDRSIVVVDRGRPSVDMADLQHLIP